MRPKIFLLLTARDGIDESVLAQAMMDEAARLDARAPQKITHMRALRIRDDALLRIAAGSFPATRSFDAAMAITLQEDDRLDALAPFLTGLSDRLKGVIEPARSAVIAGGELTILPGGGSVLVLIASHRLGHLTHEDFLRYWREKHGPWARANTPPESGLHYRQLHGDEEAGRSLAGTTGLGICDFDGAPECFYENIETMRALMTQAAIVESATADERKFVDHSRCVTSLFRVLTSNP